MASSRKRKRTSLAVKTAELGLAIPQVVAHRVTRMAMMGVCPTVRDRKEFRRMTTEKVAVFSESWSAMAAEATRVTLSLAASNARMFWLPCMSSPMPAAARLHNAGLDILCKGIAPVHRRATANARRLARTKLV